MIIISVVVPVYNAEKCLDELYFRLKNVLETITLNFEIILVEDCGVDNSWQVIERLAALDNRVKGIQFSRNFGQHYGITAGLDLSSGNWIVVMDCDLQDRPEEIPRLYAKALEGYEVVLARRGSRSDPFFKKFTSNLFYKFFNYLTDLKYDGEIGNFRILSRKVADSFCSIRENLRFFGGIINLLGFPTTSIDVKHDKRFSGHSSYDFQKLVRLAIESTLAYSDKPLRLIIRLGLVIFLFALFYGSYFFYQAYSLDLPISASESLIFSIYFLGGINIIILGILGIYLSKTFDEVKRRPLYTINQKTKSF